MEIEKLLTWGEGKEIDTKNGKRWLRKSKPCVDFWNVWKTKKEELKKLGVSVSKSDYSGEWEVCWWQELSAEYLKQKEEKIEQSKAVDAKIVLQMPANLQYMPFQKAGIDFGLNRGNILLADEMGLGKTIQAIGIINNSDPKKILIVCPASIKINWKRELEKWLIKKYSIEIANGSMLKSDITIINYNILKKFHEEIQKEKWDLLIVDEAHYCKNRKSQRTAEVLSIVSDKKIYMTGTPIVNRPIELWTLANSLDSKNFNNFWAFAKRYCGASRGDYGWDMSGATNLDELQEKLRTTIMVRRLKKDVLKELPAKIRQVIVLPGIGIKAVEEEKQIHSKFEGLKKEFEQKAKKAKKENNKEEYKKAIEGLRETQLKAFTEMARARHEVALAKVPFVIEKIEEFFENNPNEKLIVFAHHHDVVEKLLEPFNGISVKLTGECNINQKQESVDKFQNDPNIKLFVGSITAAGVGITLTASSNVIFAELDWVPGNLSQAEDRCHRIGQDNSVLIQHIVLDESFDCHMAKVLIEKQEIIEKGLNPDDLD